MTSCFSTANLRKIKIKGSDRQKENILFLLHPETGVLRIRKTDKNDVFYGKVAQNTVANFCDSPQKRRFFMEKENKDASQLNFCRKNFKLIKKERKNEQSALCEEFIFWVVLIQEIKETALLLGRKPDGPDDRDKR